MAETEDIFDSAAEAIEAWEAEHGVELDQEQFDYLTQVVEQTADTEGAASVDDVVARLEAEQDDAELFEDDEPDQNDGVEAFQRDAATEFQRLESKLGRKLTQREVDAVSDGLVEQAQRYDQISAEEAPRDLSR